MGRFRPLVRIGLISLPLIAAGCSSGENLGIDASDPNCVLLCALSRSLTGEAPKPLPQPASTPGKPKVSNPKRAAPIHLTRPHRKPLPHAAPPEPSVAAPEAAAPPPAPLPASPPASSPAPAAPAAPPNNGDLGQNPPAPRSQGTGLSIPGSATIIEPSLQGQ